METNRIKNLRDLATTPLHRAALEMVNSGLNAVDTKIILKKNITLSGHRLTVKDKEFDLAKFDKIIFIGLGKAAGEAALFFDKLLGSRITAGVVLDLKKVNCRYIKSYKADHPRPSAENVSASQKIVDLARGISENDFVITVVSGGGSAMLCWPAEECEKSVKLYDSFLKTGGHIKELNVIRKHTSLIKGGGLAKIFYPAKIVGLIFSDIAGDNYHNVASGPTYLDETSVETAQKIIAKYGLSGIEMLETDKEKKYFNNVVNIPMVSNKTALASVKSAAQDAGFTATILSEAVYENAEQTIANFQKSSAPRTVLIAGGEINISIKNSLGKGGRNQYLAMKFLPSIKTGEVFISIASDGLDNSDAAGAIIDSETVKKAGDKKLDYEKYLADYNTYDFFNETGSLIFTGPTGANVADLMLLLRK
ncbi:MAG: DUF4147 domain-containing protein [Candidatus Sungbacteria bacterium]|uniref:DUF4147 domain-containing protein n=1 Tax=Candidatus Sungiibacteriota bacterium TaxID=2750080 RepID=A0A931YDM2_9BACT|nr:DUF4147 domain-containing protein [Candidatus Sungbacteria bacterium]